MVEEGRETVTESGEAHQAGGEAGGLETSEQPNVDLRRLVEFLARNLVTRPEGVEVSESVGDDCTVLELRVDKDDLGRVIGKQGRTAKSLRTILNAAASRLNTKAALEIVEE